MNWKKLDKKENANEQKEKPYVALLLNAHTEKNACVLAARPCAIRYTLCTRHAHTHTINPRIVGKAALAPSTHTFCVYHLNTQKPSIESNAKKNPFYESIFFALPKRDKERNPLIPSTSTAATARMTTSINIVCMAPIPIHRISVPKVEWQVFIMRLNNASQRQAKKKSVSSQKKKWNDKF